MYKAKGHMKVFNGEKFKIVSYLKEGDYVIFTTDRQTRKYSEFVLNKEIKILIGGTEKTYPVKIIEDEKVIDGIFRKLKKTWTIPFFIPRKNKVIVRYHLDSEMENSFQYSF